LKPKTSSTVKGDDGEGESEASFDDAETEVSEDSDKVSDYFLLFPKIHCHIFRRELGKK